MREQLQKRLAELESEYASGQRTLAELELREHTQRETLWRISGAIQAIKEELAKPDDQLGRDGPMTTA